MAPDRSSPLSRLSDGERRVLLLLGSGHTAKSIAAETGLSVHAVNERLREARRKTGIGSSRELARLLLAQENRDNKIGVEEPTLPGEAAGMPPDPTGGRRRTSVMASSVILGVIGVAAYLSGQDAAPAVAEDRLLGGLLAQRVDDDPRELYRRVRRERRDETWASNSEATLRDRYAAAAGLPAAQIRVTCATTLCEVASPAAAIDPGSLARIQQLGLSELADIGFRAPVFTIGEDAFAAYLSRDAGSAPMIVATAPVRNAVIPAGPFTLSVTFDQPMTANSVSFTTPEGLAAYPSCAVETLRQSSDGRTYSMRCVAQPGKTYAVGFNSGAYRNFRSREGTPAMPAVLRFRAEPASR